MEMKSLKRDKTFVIGKLRTQKDNSVYTTKECSIIIPKRFLDTKLCNLDNGNRILAIFIMVMDGRYTLFNATAIMHIGDANRREILLDGVECIEFNYGVGDVVIENLNLFVDNTLIYYITNNITKKGFTLPYLTYNDFQLLLISNSKFAGLSMPNYAYVNIYLSYVCRDKKDKMKPIRLSSNEDYINIPLSSVIYAVDNTVNKLNGSYLDDGVQSALIYPTDSVSAVEKVLGS